MYNYMNTIKMKAKSVSGVIGKRVKELRKEMKISQAKLATMASVSKTYIFKIEKGKMTNIGFETLEQICAALRVPPIFLFMEEQELSDLLDKAERENVLTKEFLTLWPQLDEQQKMAHISMAKSTLGHLSGLSKKSKVS